jgi:hypothetical protein
MALPAHDEHHRRVCEARFWIRQGFVDATSVDALLERIAKRRGQAAADALRAEMREQWRGRAGWLVAGQSEG